jgi:hypothetical protein
VTAELACALAALGQDGKAAKVAGWDMTGTAVGRLHATVAELRAGDGDPSGALAAVALIGDPRVAALAFCGIAKGRQRPGAQPDRAELGGARPERAVDVARDIGNEDRAGEALVTAALAIVARDRGGWPAATAIIDGVTSPGWQATGLAVVAAAKVKGQHTDAREYFAKVDELISKVPEGEPRARTQRAIIEVAVASGDYEVAVRLARGVTSGRSHVLSELTSNLAARGAAEAVKSLLKDCAQEAESAYAACLALAHAVPGQADAIATEVAAS